MRHSPITARTGRVLYDETDLLVPARGAPFEFTRYYNSHTDRLGPFGFGWSHSYHWPMKIEGTGPFRTVTITTPDLSILRFEEMPGGAGWQTNQHHGYSLTSGGGGGTFTLRHGKMQIWYQEGRVTQIHKPGSSISLGYDLTTTDTNWGPLLNQITDSVGNTYSVTWTPVSTGALIESGLAGGNHHLLTSIRQDATGRIFQYSDGDILALVTVTDSAYPQAAPVTYSYSMAPATYNLEWVYDRTGRPTHHFTYDYEAAISYQEIAEISQTYTRNTTEGYLIVTKGSRTKRVDYNTDDQITRMVDYDGTVLDIAYDSQTHRVSRKEITDFQGSKTILVYQTGCDCPNPQPVSITDPQGGVTLFEYDANDNLVRVIDPLGRQTVHEYGEAGHVGPNDQYHRTATIDPLGHRTEFTYALSGLMTSMSEGPGRLTTYGYTPFDQLASVTAPNGGITRYEYNSGRFLIRTTDPDGAVTQLARDLAGRIVTKTDPEGDTTTFTYTDNDLIASKTDPLGRITEFSYSGGPEQALIQVQLSGNLRFFGTDSHGNRVTDSWDPYLMHEFDETDRLTATWRANGDQGVLFRFYDQVGRPLLERDVPGPLLYGSPPPASGSDTSRVYDSLGRVVTTFLPDGRTITRTYDAVGNVLAEKSTSGDITSWTYDAANRPVSRSAPGGRVTTWVYDAFGNRIAEIDPAGHSTAYTYDALNRLTAVRDPLGHETAFVYSQAGDLTQITDAKGQVWTFGYDAAHRLLRETNPLSQSTFYTYDAAGNLVGRLDAKGQSTVQSYDAQNRLSSVQYSDGTSVTASYDTAGDMTQLAAPGYFFTQVWTYRRPVQQTYLIGPVASPVTAMTRLEYDAQRRLSKVEVLSPSLSSTQYERDSRGRLTRLGVSLSDGAPMRWTTYTYGAHDALESVSRPNGVITTYAYTVAGDLARLDHHTATQQLGFFQYAYNAEGLRTGRVTQAGAETYGYDAAHRLVQSVAPFEIETFAYDPVGNLLAIGNNAGLRLYAYDTANRLLSEGGATPATYTHDANGNLVARVQQAGAAVAYQWDPRDKLKAVSVNGTVAATYSYHPLSDLLLTKAVPGQHREWRLWHEQNPLVDIQETAEGPPVVTKVYGAAEGYDQIESVHSTALTTTHYPLRDALLSVHQLANEEGQPVASYRYSAYGEPRAWTDASGTANRFTYTGREWDEQAGAYYYRARWYHPQTGRFVSEDPLFSRLFMAFVVGRHLPAVLRLQNLYRYTENRPVNMIDPSGLMGSQMGDFDFILHIFDDMNKTMEKLGNPRLSPAERAALEAHLNEAWAALSVAIDRFWIRKFPFKFIPIIIEPPGGFMGDKGCDG